MNTAVKNIGLSNNQLKLIAMATMLMDHIGKVLLPRLLILQILGRLAFPIFAYMIAEGCHYTRSRRKYLLQLAALAAVCQIAYTIATGSLYQSILVTFVLSVLTIYCADAFVTSRSWKSGVVFALEFAAAAAICLLVPKLLPGRDFQIDYGFFGMLLPVAVYFAPGKLGKLLAAAACLLLLGCSTGWIQWYALLAVPLLWLYNGQRGKAKLKHLFYIFYPAHLVIIQGISMLLPYFSK